MPLLDLKTNLKSLKYGNDQPGGGSSGQPYVTTDINTVGTFTRFDDGLIRGGFIGATAASAVDTIRIGKFLTDFPKGPLFITKQIGLQLSNPRLEVKKLKTDNPTRGGGLLRNVGNFILNTANKIQNAVDPTRIYNLGINTLAQVPVNAFGGHLNRHGFLPVQDDQTKYFSVVLNNNDKDNNRLVQLKDKLIGTENNIIDNYIGGPSSVYGIGRTLIRRRGDFIVVNQDITGNEWAVKGAKEAGINYRLIGHEGGTRDGYTDASRRITNFTEVSDKTGSLFAPSPIFYKDKRSIQSVFGGRRDNTPLGLDDKIASNSDIIDSKYNAAVQEASASDKMRTPLAFVGASTKISSSFVSNKFPNLTSVGTYKRTTLEDKIASSDDPKKDTYIALGLEASASAKMRTSLGFVGASTKTSSSFVSNKFPDLTDFGAVGEYKRTTLDDYIASAKDISDNLLNNPWVNQISSSADLGLSKLGNDTPTGSNDIDASLNQNAVNYNTTNNSIKTYAKLRAQIDKNSNITQNYFKTADITINRGKASGPKFTYLSGSLDTVSRRENDKNIEKDTMALKFIPLDPFSGNALNVLNFLGYLSEYNEDYNSTWNDVKYTGRAEKFYIFNEFKRTINVGFQIPCFNQKELIEKHCTLSELASTLAGKYENNLLGGIITRLTIGNYINNQPGIITNLNFSPIDGSSWDLDLLLTYYLKVSFGFTIIHDYVPQYYNCGFIFKKPEPEPIIPPSPPDPPLPPKPNPTLSPVVTNDTGSFRAPLGRVDLRARPDNTLVKSPVKLSGLKPKEFKYGGGSFGAAGAGGVFLNK